MEKYIYLGVNLASIIICFIYSFHPRSQFYKHFGAFIKAAILVSIPFLLWDAYFTQVGVWWFNDRYILGFRLLGLPLEEWMFFYCIPFACLFTYYIITKFNNWNYNDTISTGFLILLGLGIGLSHMHYIYTSWAFISFSVSLIILKYILKQTWLGQFTLVYAVLLIPFFMVNGILTGTGLEEAIVNYAPHRFLGLRIGTVPVEDAFYGYTLIAWNIYFYNYFDKK